MIVPRLRARHPEVELRPFNTASLADRPLILLGAITGVAEAGSIPGVVGRPPGAYRIWAVLADLQSGLVISHPVAWVRKEDVNPAPVGASRDAPVWLPDEVNVAAY